MLLLAECRECGCDDFNACVMSDGWPCWWVEADLCSNCAEPEWTSDRTDPDYVSPELRGTNLYPRPPRNKYYAEPTKGHL